MGWIAKAFFCAMFVGGGLALVVFADQLADFNIRIMQSKGYRLAVRFIGGLLVVLGIGLAGVFVAGIMR